MRCRPWCYGCLAAALSAVLLAEAGGCAQLFATVAYLTVGTDQPAEYPGLKGKKVVVVCRPLAGLQYRDSVAAREVATQVSLLLKDQVPKIKVVEQQKVAEWTDENTWDEYPEVGKALDADIVVGIELTSFSTYQGPTLYQGRATASVKVFDLKDDNKVVFAKDMQQILYPPDVGIPISAEKSEADFRREFVQVVASRIGRHFYSYDPHDDVAVNAKAGL